MGAKEVAQEAAISTAQAVAASQSEVVLTKVTETIVGATPPGLATTAVRAGLSTLLRMARSRVELATRLVRRRIAADRGGGS